MHAFDLFFLLVPLRFPCSHINEVMPNGDYQVQCKYGKTKNSPKVKI